MTTELESTVKSEPIASERIQPRSANFCELRVFESAPAEGQTLGRQMVEIVNKLTGNQIFISDTGSQLNTTVEGVWAEQTTLNNVPERLDIICDDEGTILASKDRKFIVVSSAVLGNHLEPNKNMVALCWLLENRSFRWAINSRGSEDFNNILPDPKDFITRSLETYSASTTALANWVEKNKSVYMAKNASVV